MAETIRVTNRMKNIVKAFKSTSDANWIHDLKDTAAIDLILCEWVRQNFTHIEAEEILRDP